MLATTTWWIHDCVLDTDHFVAITAPLADDPAVQEQLVTVTTTQLNEALNLGPIGSYVVTGISREVYASDAFASIWERAMGQSTVGSWPSCAAMRPSSRPTTARSS